MEEVISRVFIAGQRLDQLLLQFHPLIDEWVKAFMDGRFQHVLNMKVSVITQWGLITQKIHVPIDRNLVEGSIIPGFVYGKACGVMQGLLWKQLVLCSRI